MSRTLTPCLLSSGKSPDTELQLIETELRPGFSISSGRDKTLLLAGGFSSVFPESDFPLSPTLQLNHDLASFDPKDLKQIAEAEVRRLNGVSFRSYIVEPDARACVVGDDPGQVKAFLDNYGGILQLEPLLLKGFDPEIPTAIELSLEKRGRQWYLEYSERAPVDPEKCSYCGECGVACPLRCISQKLFVDFKICNFCKECEDVCETGAIDIHGALRRSLEVPAVIIVGELQVDLPKNAENIFYADNIAEFFATLFPCHVDEVVSCDRTICQFNGHLRNGCDLCVSHCRYGAVIKGDDGVFIDHLKCEECGACVSVCPTGTLQNERFNDGSFVDYFQSIDLPQDGTVIIGDEQALHHLWWTHGNRQWSRIFFLQYENVESLSLFHFMLLLHRGARRVVVLNTIENKLNNAPAPSLQKQIALGSEKISKLFDIDDAIFSSSAWDIDDVLSQEVDGSLGRGQGVISYTNRRQALGSLLEEFVSRSGREVEISFDGYIPFATVSCRSGRCTECMACLNVCRIGAMVADSERFVLSNVGVMCVGCGLCLRVCPEDALVISPEFTLGKSFFSETELSRAEPMACKGCGKVFGTRGSYERVMAILMEKEAVDTGHFEYCDTCRVVQLFESE